MNTEKTQSGSGPTISPAVVALLLLIPVGIASWQTKSVMPVLIGVPLILVAALVIHLNRTRTLGWWRPLTEQLAARFPDAHPRGRLEMTVASGGTDVLVQAIGASRKPQLKMWAPCSLPTGEFAVMPVASVGGAGSQGIRLGIVSDFDRSFLVEGADTPALRELWTAERQRALMSLVERDEHTGRSVVMYANGELVFFNIGDVDPEIIEQAIGFIAEMAGKPAA